MSISNILNKYQLDPTVVTKYFILFLLATIVPTIYIFVTNHIWEDFFITFRHSQNLAEGNGLVFNPGERVHGFTSPINTILPALTYIITGKSGYEPALALYRVVSIMAFAFGITYFFYKLGQYTTAGLLPKIFLFILLTLEVKTVVYAANGQEAGFLALFLLPLAILVRYEPNRWLLIGALCAGLQYTRPDGVIYYGSIIAVNFLFSDNKKHFIRCLLPRYAAVCTALYLPWFITMWMYYGSPVPNTIVAKSHYGNFSKLFIIDQINMVLANIPYAFSRIYLPIYFHFGGWPPLYNIFAFIIGFFSFFYWLLPTKETLPRVFSAIFAILTLYLAYLNASAAVFPWYQPPAALIGLVTFVLGINSLIRQFKISKTITTLSITSLYLAFSLVTVSLFYNVTKQLKYQQDIIENNQRMQIGLWLNKNSIEGETIYLEPLGYIGYFSQRKMLDYPGLVSPSIIKLIAKHGPLQHNAIITDAKPDWVVLRPREAQVAQQILGEKYTLKKGFDVLPEIAKVKDEIYGIGYLVADSQFLIYKRKE